MDMKKEGNFLDKMSLLSKFMRDNNLQFKVETHCFVDGDMENYFHIEDSKGRLYLEFDFCKNIICINYSDIDKMILDPNGGLKILSL